MNWWLPRLLVATLAMLLGALLGSMFADSPQATLGMAMLGGSCGIGIVLARDGLRAYRLLKWLRGAQIESPRRDMGFWGELAYRTERALRQRERALAQEKQQLEQFLAAIDASPNGVLLLDAQDQITWCNSRAADHFELDPHRDRLQRLTNLVRMPPFVAYLQAGDFREPVVFNGPLGRSILSVLVRPFGEGNKLVLSQDITERERTEAMRRDFVANVSHEIRTPLTVVAGFVETMSTLPLSDAERQHVLQLMSQQTTRMQTLVSDLLILAQLEGSPRPPPDRWISVAALLRHVESDARALSMGRHVLRFSGGADAEIAGSDAELQSAVGNLVHNAVRYTPEHGHIDIIWQWRDDGGAEIEVIDDGAGIAREHLPRLTERFYRVDSSRSRETGGTGLGLSIVKHVVQRHGGEIDIRSEPGKGSCFKLVFPGHRVRNRAAADGAEQMPVLH